MWYDIGVKEVDFMENHGEKAARLFREGYNCAQSVFVAYCDLTGLDETTAIRLSSSFGGGMGRLREVCGTVSGAIMVLGVLRASEDPTDLNAKAAHYALVQDFARRFKERNETIICRELLEKQGNEASTAPMPDARTAEYYKKRPCVLLVRCAAEILEEMLEEFKAEQH